MGTRPPSSFSSSNPCQAPVPLIPNLHLKDDVLRLSLHLRELCIEARGHGRATQSVGAGGGGVVSANMRISAFY